jgi:cyanate lyase
MTRDEATRQIVAARLAKRLSWRELAERVGRHPVWTTAALLGQHAMSEQEAQAAAGALGLGPDVAAALVEYPTRGVTDQPVPTDPTIYRLYELVLVYGPTIKALIHEEFGDGIMSAIDFSMDLKRVEDPKGDRVQLTMNGKFLPYKKF